MSTIDVSGVRVQQPWLATRGHSSTFVLCLPRSSSSGRMCPRPNVNSGAVSWSSVLAYPLSPDRPSAHGEKELCEPRPPRADSRHSPLRWFVPTHPTHELIGRKATALACGLRQGPGSLLQRCRSGLGFFRTLWLAATGENALDRNDLVRRRRPPDRSCLSAAPCGVRTIASWLEVPERGLRAAPSSPPLLSVRSRSRQLTLLLRNLARGVHCPTRE